MFSYLHLSVPSKSSFNFMVIDCCLRPQESWAPKLSFTIIIEVLYYHNNKLLGCYLFLTANLRKYILNHIEQELFYFNTIHAYSVVPGTNGFYLI